MIRTFTPCLTILSPAQQQLWPALRPAPQLGFVLYGGTAIALRLGHRPSLDYDFFTDRPLSKDELYAAFPFLRQSTLLQDTPDALTVLVPPSAPTDQHVKISFFGMLSFGRVGVPELTDDGIVQVAALDDLMATKVRVILQRIEAKDYQDIAAMIRSGIGLSQGLASARAMFGPAFQPSESLKALVYFEGGDLHRLTHEERRLLVEAASSVRALPTVDIHGHALASPRPHKSPARTLSLANRAHNGHLYLPQEKRDERDMRERLDRLGAPVAPVPLETEIRLTFNLSRFTSYHCQLAATTACTSSGR